MSLFRAARPVFQSLRWQISPRPIARSVCAVGLGLGLSLYASKPVVYCDGSRPTSPALAPSSPTLKPQPERELPPPPLQSSVNTMELGFGTVAGICAGVFVKKGAKLVAFLLGGMFVFLQYTGSLGIVKVDWKAVDLRFRRAFYTVDPKTGEGVAPTVGSVWGRLVHFLTADFQPRASFLAGFLLGLRVG
ncbi:SAM-MT-RSMB-NOP domain-containing protein [Mycena kentingensis (nom. inval.)]|nr:SAM-MT-RSMB-NOP domain-containing protein [Mycena kentingensis (nom. inval.)]